MTKCAQDCCTFVITSLWSTVTNPKACKGLTKFFTFHFPQAFKSQHFSAANQLSIYYCLKGNCSSESYALSIKSLNAALGSGKDSTGIKRDVGRADHFKKENLQEGNYIWGVYSMVTAVDPFCPIYFEITCILYDGNVLAKGRITKTTCIKAAFPDNYFSRWINRYSDKTASLVISQD